MRGWSGRVTYLIVAAVVVVLGLLSRTHGDTLPVFLARFAGDTLWALMVFLLISAAIPNTIIVQRAGIAIAFSFAVEFSQLYHAPWIDAIRGTTIGGLVLGFDFVWSDLICYAAGVSIGLAAESLFVRDYRIRKKAD